MEAVFMISSRGDTARASRPARGTPVVIVIAGVLPLYVARLRK